MTSPPKTTATASGLMPASRSNSSCMHGPAVYSASVRFHSSTICLLSHSLSISMPPTGSSARLHIPLTRFTKCPPRRSIVASSYNSSSYSTAPSIPTPSSTIPMLSSNFDPLCPMLTPLTFPPPPPSLRSFLRLLSSVNITWNSGLRLMSLSSTTSSTTFSNGTSWWPYAPSALSLTPLITSLKLIPPLTSPLITSVFTKNPISPSTSLRPLFATGVPTSMSSCPLYLITST